MPSANCTTGSAETPSSQVLREREALASPSVLGYRARIQGLNQSALSKATGISKERIARLEALPSHSSPTSHEAAQIHKVLGSGDLFTALTPDSAMAERVRLA
jgi:Helix-turn-helix